MMPVEFAVLLPPLAAGLLVLSSHLLLGEQVLKRGILFIDLAVAQLAALGSLLAQQWGTTLAMAPLGGVLLAVSGAVLIGHWARMFPQQREAIIGLVYAGAASVLLLVLAADPHAGHRLSRSLNGDILWVGWSEMLPLALLTPVFLLLWCRRGHWLAGRAFYPCFALLVSLSVPLLGVYLVFVTLIAPALVGQLSGGGRSAAVLTGGLGYTAGLVCAWWLDWPAGATVVLAILATSCSGLILDRLYRGYSAVGSSYSGSS
ncbi:zinc/manganese transport system permease protein [Marinobacterium halophilum]|uniref:Zinc/manganese transport system permease protein n=1 Tax=Marinobacterium halophilum TaxID=267374 RepID=A0A2P8F4T5_9GAMM|nr:metal ABC transporter permease [Marinobacterium halophilum]PSL16733.1 zinc/manganese transport system permease protein [Marinobacterium halophilum]